MKLEVINFDGKKISNVEISDKIISINPNKNVVKSVQKQNFPKKTLKTSKNFFK